MNFTEHYISLIEQFRSVELAEQELRRQMDDDTSLRTGYYAWCEENELSPRSGLKEFGRAYIENREARWDMLEDFDSHE